MTHRTRPPSRICPACDGFASAAVTLGGRDHRGHLNIITAYCTTCHGTGILPARRRLTAAQWEVAA
jgi:cytochrome c5